MGKYKDIVQSAAEQLLEDEELRSNLTDDEANIMINWAIKWLQGQVDQAQGEAAASQAAQAELARLRPALQDINRQLAGGKTPAAGAPFGLSLSRAVKGAPPDRKTLIHSLIDQQVKTWHGSD